MLNPFATPAMAAGYARSRLEIARPLDRALDVGCGAGLSTRPLLSIARHCIGADPAEAMLRCAAGANSVTGYSFPNFGLPYLAEFTWLIEGVVFR